MIALKKSISFLMGFCALIVAIAMVSVGVTMAIWQGSTKETNVLTIGNVKIELIDIYDYPKDDPPEFQPSNDNAISKKVSVKNVGNTLCYVRVLIKKEWTDASGNEVAGLSTGLIAPHYDPTGQWVRGTNLDGEYSGYEVYYYQNKLEPGKEALEPLFSEFYFRESYTDNDGATYTFNISEYGGKFGNIKVLAQAVQSEYLGERDSDFGLKYNASHQIIGWPNSLVFN